MMRTMMAAGVALMLGACGEAPEQAPEQRGTANLAAPETGAAAQVAKLDDETRNVVLQKAIRASGLPCPAVTGAERAEVRPGVRGWRAQCNDDTAHLIEIAPDGTAKVTSRR